MAVRLAIIGAGIMGGDHARIFAEEIPGATIQVICDASPDRAAQLAASVGAFETLADPQIAISRADVDAVVIASPDNTHTPLSLACIAARKPVLCEKPLSQSPEECRDVIAAEVAAGRRWVQLGFMRRFDQSYMDFRSALAEGRIGRALMMHNFHRNVETPAADFTGAMAITNSAPHEFDVVRHVLGAEFVSISAVQPKRSDALVAPVVMVLETAAGQVVTIEVNNNAAYGYDVRAELIGESGSVQMLTTSSSRLDSALAARTSYDADWRGRYAEAYRRQNREFLHFVQNGAFPTIAADAWDGYCATLVADAGARALHLGQRISVEVAKRPGIYADR